MRLATEVLGVISIHDNWALIIINKHDAILSILKLNCYKD